MPARPSLERSEISWTAASDKTEIPGSGGGGQPDRSDCNWRVKFQLCRPGIRCSFFFDSDCDLVTTVRIKMMHHTAYSKKMMLD
jgi:hypothetical protein